MRNTRRVMTSHRTGSAAQMIKDSLYCSSSGLNVEFRGINVKSHLGKELRNLESQDT
jgi:hypothetical protein